ncbi:MAG: glycosyltransferase [Fimbriimonadaceae bacterium]|nr:glycosyltransferase [Fimbriimonadaceae bacterium]
MIYVWGILVGWFGVVTVTNLLLMRRPPKKGADEPAFTVLIPARNEAKNIQTLVQQCREQGASVVVLDDQSTDATGQIARDAGAQVVRGSEPPTGWTGKNWACHQLAQVAAEVAATEWIAFVDADVQFKPGGVAKISHLLAAQRPGTNIVSGFLQTRSGRFPEALVTNWMWQMLLMTNPFGLVTLTGQGHNQFLNGQFIALRAGTYVELRPHEAVKGEVLEDVKMGRWLAKQKQRVLVANLSGCAAVRMYENAGDAWAGVTKNAAAIAGSKAASVALAFFWLALPVLAAIEVVRGNALALLALAPAVVAHLTIQRAGGFGLLYPLDALMGSLAILASSAKKQVEWKGRSYEGVTLPSGPDSESS